MSREHKEADPKIEIAPADPKDVRGMAEVYRTTWLATYPNKEAGITVDDIEDVFKDSFTEEALAKRAERIRHPKEGYVFLVAKDGDKVIGVCSVIKHPDKNQLASIYVLPEYQGRGVGSLFWAEAQKHFDADKDTIVQVVTYNANAIGFYKKLGFQETGKKIMDERFRMKSGAITPETELVIKAEINSN
jgi:ribosomal protein S18 acetylase RimI-like enzyme